MAEFRILTICTGNICRSPAAEQLLSSGLGPEVEVSSAGTGAVVGHPVEPDMLTLLRRAGVPEQPFAARQLTAQMVRESDLILALTTEHRAQAVRLAPAALRRAFTLLEFARIVGSDGFPEVLGESVSARLREMVVLAAPRRRMGVIVHDDDVPDPYRCGPDVFEESFGLVRGAVETIVRVAAHP